MKSALRLNLLLLLVTMFSAACVQDDACSSNSAASDNKNCQNESPITEEPPVVAPEPEEPGAPEIPSNPDEPTDPADDVTDTESLRSPWNKSFTSIVIDAYEGNSIDWNAMATDEKMVGVIHRSSIGLRKDTQYESRKSIAKSRGYLWGAYHLGRRGDTLAQVNFFLDIINSEDDTLMILDLEDTSSSSFMSIDESIKFMEYVYERTGKIPVVYANHSTTKLLNQKVSAHPLFRQAKFWYARFKSTVTDFPSGIWQNYFLWQFSSEINCSRTGSCLYNVPGTKYDMDVNVYHGSPDQLAADWNND